MMIDYLFRMPKFPIICILEKSLSGKRFEKVISDIVELIEQFQ